MKKTLLILSLLFSPNVFAFDPVAQGATMLVSSVCLGSYANDQAKLNAWLDGPGIKKASDNESEKWRHNQTDDVYIVQSVSKYILVLSKDNRCSLFVEDMNIANGINSLKELRQGLSKNPNIKEKIKKSEVRHMASVSYSYYKMRGNLAMRISNSYPKSIPKRGLFAISVVSAMRASNSQ